MRSKSHYAQEANAIIAKMRAAAAAAKQQAVEAAAMQQKQQQVTASLTSGHQPQNAKKLEDEDEDDMVKVPKSFDEESQTAVSSPHPDSPTSQIGLRRMDSETGPLVSIKPVDR